MPVNINVIFQAKRLEQVTTQKFLGVWFQENFAWGNHVNKLSNDLSKVVGCMYKIGDIIPLWLKKAMYYALCYSKQTYCTLIWGTRAKKYEKLLNLQKWVVRIFENYHGELRDLPTLNIFNKHSLIQANQVFYYRLLLHIKKQRLHVVSLPISPPLYPLHNKIRTTPFTRTNYGRQDLNYQIPKLLNIIEQRIDFCSPF